MTTPRSGFQTEVIDGKIYAIGGLNNKVGDSKWTRYHQQKFMIHPLIHGRFWSLCPQHAQLIGGVHAPSMESYAVPKNATQ